MARLARVADRTFLYIVQPAMLGLAIWWLVAPEALAIKPDLFWFWIAFLLALFVETVWSYSIARYVGRTRAFLFKLLLTAATNIVSFAAIYRVTGMMMMDGTIVDGLSDAVYFSIITWTTVGYGDIVPVDASRLFAAAQGFLGYIYTATIVGVVMVEVGVQRGR